MLLSIREVDPTSNSPKSPPNDKLPTGSTLFQGLLLNSECLILCSVWLHIPSTHLHIYRHLPPLAHLLLVSLIKTLKEIHFNNNNFSCFSSFHFMSQCSIVSCSNPLIVQFWFPVAATLAVAVPHYTATSIQGQSGRKLQSIT